MKLHCSTGATILTRVRTETDLTIRLNTGVLAVYIVSRAKEGNDIYIPCDICGTEYTFKRLLTAEVQVRYSTRERDWRGVCTIPHRGDRTNQIREFHN